MNPGEVNWAEKAADYAWALVLVGITSLVALIRFIFTHEARLKALEAARTDDARKLESIEQKIEQNQDRVIAAIEALRKEVNDDNRMVISALLERVPRP